MSLSIFFLIFQDHLGIAVQIREKMKLISSRSLAPPFHGGQARIQVLPCAFTACEKKNTHTYIKTNNRSSRNSFFPAKGGKEAKSARRRDESDILSSQFLGNYEKVVWDSPKAIRRPPKADVKIYSPGDHRCRFRRRPSCRGEIQGKGLCRACRLVGRNTSPSPVRHPNLGF